MSLYIIKKASKILASLVFLYLFVVPFGNTDLSAQTWSLCDSPGQAVCFDDVGFSGWAHCYYCASPTTCDCGGVYPIYCGSSLECYCDSGCWGVVICSGTCLIIGD